MLRTTFSALRDRRFAAFFSGQVLSNTGTWMERAALAALVYSMTGRDEGWLMLVAAIPAVPAFGLSAWAGQIVDRTDVRRLILATQGTMLVLAILLAALVTAGVARPWHVLVYAGIASTVFAFDAPARQSFVARIVHRGDLTNALALSTVTFNVARLAGGAAFGFVMEVTDGRGEAWCFWLNAASFVFPICTLLWIREDPRPAPDPAHARGDLLGGFRYAIRTPAVRGAVALVLLASLLGFQVSNLVPVYAEKVWEVGKVGQGDLHQFLGLGALGGGLAMAALSRRVRRGRHVLRTAFYACVLLVAGAVAEDFVAGCWLFAGASFLLIQTHTGCNAILQSSVPEGLRGRVVALYTMCVLGAFPVGGLLAVGASGLWGAPSTTIVAATLFAVAVFVLAVTHRELVAAD